MRIILAMVITAISFIIAFLTVQKEKNHYNSLITLSEFVTFLLRETQVISRSFSDAMLNISKLKDSPDFAISYASYLSEKPEFAWKKAVESSKLFLNDNEKCKLIQFGENLKHCRKEEISNICSSFSLEIEGLKEQSQSYQKGKNKALSSLIMCCGMVIAVLIL